MRSLIRYAKTPRYPCNTQSPQLGFNELDVQFSRSKRGPERIASVHAALERSEAAGLTASNRQQRTLDRGKPYTRQQLDSECKNQIVQPQLYCWHSGYYTTKSLLKF
jgi:hypothetical protein